MLGLRGHHQATSKSLITPHFKGYVIVFDKTGTITKGDLTLTDAITAEGIQKEELLTVAMTVAEASTHPISRALQKGVDALEGWKNFEVQEISGKGMIGTSFDGKTIIVFGNNRWMEDNGEAVPDAFADGLIGSVSYVSGCITWMPLLQ